MARDITEVKRAVAQFLKKAESQRHLPPDFWSIPPELARQIGLPPEGPIPKMDDLEKQKD